MERDSTIIGVVPAVFFMKLIRRRIIDTSKVTVVPFVRRRRIGRSAFTFVDTERPILGYFTARYHHLQFISLVFRIVRTRI